MKTQTQWIFNNETFETRRHIKAKYGFSTSVIDAKIRDKEIIKITEQVTTDEKLYYHSK